MPWGWRLLQSPWGNIFFMHRNELAYHFAKAAHKSINQKRKYTGEDYIVHPERVVAILKQAGVQDGETLQAAFLHDVLEDVADRNPAYGAEKIEEYFGRKVLTLVRELTDEYTSKKYLKLNRNVRKGLEAIRLGYISKEAMKIKLADLIDNGQDIAKHDPGFAKLYLKEKDRILEAFEPVVVQSNDKVLKDLFEKAKLTK